MSAFSDPELVRIPELSGESGSVRLRLFNAPFLRSRNQGTWGVLPMEKDDFHLWMLAQIDRHSTAKSKSRFWGGRFYSCRQCASALNDLPEHPFCFRMTLQSPEIPAFEVQLEAPAVFCPQCQTPNFIETNEHERDLIDAQTAILFSL